MPKGYIKVEASDDPPHLTLETPREALSADVDAALRELKIMYAAFAPSPPSPPALGRAHAEIVSWNKYESRIEAEMQNLRRAYDKTRKAFADAAMERIWLADQCNVMHSSLNASPPLGITGWLEAAIFARENRTEKCPCCSEPGAPARANADSSEWVCDCSCHPREAAR